MNEILMNGFWTLLGAGIVAMAYYYGYCRGDRKRYQEMQRALEPVSDSHTEALKEAFYAGYKAGRAKKLGKVNAYKAWALEPLTKAVNGEWVKKMPDWPDHDCGDCVHGSYDVEDTDPKTYVFICKKGLPSSTASCAAFEKKTTYGIACAPFIQKEKE